MPACRAARGLGGSCPPSASDSTAAPHSPHSTLLQVSQVCWQRSEVVVAPLVHAPPAASGGGACAGAGLAGVSGSSGPGPRRQLRPQSGQCPMRSWPVLLDLCESGTPLPWRCSLGQTQLVAAGPPPHTNPPPSPHCRLQGYCGKGARFCAKDRCYSGACEGSTQQGPAPSRYPQAPFYSLLWGQRGERWSPAGRLPDLSYAGYAGGRQLMRAAVCPTGIFCGCFHLREAPPRWPLLSRHVPPVRANLRGGSLPCPPPTTLVQATSVASPPAVTPGCSMPVTLVPRATASQARVV